MNQKITAIIVIVIAFLVLAQPAAHAQLTTKYIVTPSSCTMQKTDLAGTSYGPFQCNPVPPYVCKSSTILNTSPRVTQNSMSSFQANITEDGFSCKAQNVSESVSFSAPLGGTSASGTATITSAAKRIILSVAFSYSCVPGGGIFEKNLFEQSPRRCGSSAP